jgi:hypothetical protein
MGEYYQHESQRNRMGHCGLVYLTHTMVLMRAGMKFWVQYGDKFPELMSNDHILKKNSPAWP